MKISFCLAVILCLSFSSVFGEMDTLRVSGTAYSPDITVKARFGGRLYMSKVVDSIYDMSLSGKKGLGYIRYRNTYKVYLSEKKVNRFCFQDIDGREELIVNDEINQYLRDKNKRLKKNSLEIKYFNLPVYKKDYEEFVNFIDSVFSVQKNILNEAKFEDKYFNYIENIELLSLRANFVLKYLLINKINSIPDLSFMQGIKLNDTLAYTASDEYKKFINLYLDKIAQDSIKKNGLSLNDYLFVKYEKINEVIGCPEIKYNLLTILIEKAVSQFGVTEEVTRLYRGYVAKTPDKYRSEKVQILYRKMDALSKGEVPPIVAYDQEKNEVFLENLLGQKIYLMLYSFHCKECLDELQFIKAHEELFERNNIAIVTIAMDGGDDEWRSFIKTQNIQGSINLHAFNNRREIMGKLMVRKLPTVIIVDSNHMITNLRAPKLTEDNFNALFKL
jgi:peroxiredoxin